MVEQYGVTLAPVPKTLKYNSRKRAGLRRKILLIRVILGLLIGIIVLGGLVALFWHFSGRWTVSSSPSVSYFDNARASTSAHASLNTKTLTRELEPSSHPQTLGQKLFSILKTKRAIAAIIIVSALILIGIIGSLIMKKLEVESREQDLMSMEEARFDQEYPTSEGLESVDGVTGVKNNNAVLLIAFISGLILVGIVIFLFVLYLLRSRNAGRESIKWESTTFQGNDFSKVRDDDTQRRDRPPDGYFYERRSRSVSEDHRGESQSVRFEDADDITREYTVRFNEMSNSNNSQDAEIDNHDDTVLNDNHEDEHFGWEQFQDH